MSREAARLALLDGTDVLYLARYEGTNPIRLTANIGDRFPAHVTATGKAVLSTLPDAWWRTATGARPSCRSPRAP
ncbi:IclR family transcriptional regulator domain-containing protein [Arthrobacter sp. Hiyo1]|uniref:IclR family transcriptional regulator domain-containing protein n=1 Tax=Arthrobacter sp. Hiyo1 TaxID=1588020 RepID=UPI00403FFDC3